MKTTMIAACALLVLPFCLGFLAPAEKGELLVFIGTYTRGNSKGIYACRFDPTQGTLSAPELVAETPNPSFVAIHPNRRFLYAVGEQGKGFVKGFAIDPVTGKLTAINEKTSGGNGPCYVTLDRSGTVALVANYGSGSVEALPVGQDGSLGDPTAFIQHTGSSVNPSRQKQPHAHSINPSPDNRFAVAADLGLDKLLVYRLDPKNGTLAPNDPPFAEVEPGSGPRHFAFHPNGRYAYVINEIKSTVTAFSYDTNRGVLKPIQTITTLPHDFSGKNSTAEVQVHPSGKFVYGSNRGHDSIAVFAVSADGTLAPVEHVSTGGREPRNFGIDPSGKWLLAANQSSANVVVFRIDPKAGTLKATGQSVQVDYPVCVKFLSLK